MGFLKSLSGSGNGQGGASTSDRSAPPRDSELRMPTEKSGHSFCRARGVTVLRCVQAGITTVLVDAATRGMANVVVYLDRVPSGMTVPAVPKARVTLSVDEGRFEPRISVLRRGQTCAFTNKDPETTNVHTFAIVNSALNQLI